MIRLALLWATSRIVFSMSKEKNRSGSLPEIVSLRREQQARSRFHRRPRHGHSLCVRPLRGGVRDTQPSAMNWLHFPIDANHSFGHTELQRIGHKESGTTPQYGPFKLRRQAGKPRQPGDAGEQRRSTGRSNCDGLTRFRAIGFGHFHESKHIRQLAIALGLVAVTIPGNAVTLRDDNSIEFVDERATLAH
jgi:hypothetical protein